MVTGIRLRGAVRVVVLDREDRALLVRWHFEDPDGPVDIWGTPGGGIDSGEELEDAVRRELLEETGLEVDDCGPCVAHRRHVAPMRATDGAEWDGQEEWFFLVRTERFRPRGVLSDAELRQERLHELRWCSTDQIQALGDEPRTTTAPSALADLVRRLAESGHPAEPLELDV